MREEQCSAALRAVLTVSFAQCRDQSIDTFVCQDPFEIGAVYGDDANATDDDVDNFPPNVAASQSVIDLNVAGVLGTVVLTREDAGLLRFALYAISLLFTPLIADA